MLKSSYSRQFERDLKRMMKQGKKGEKIKAVMRKLINEDKLEPRYRDHKLVRNRTNWVLGICVKCSPYKGSILKLVPPESAGMETAWAIRASRMWDSKLFHVMMVGEKPAMEVTSECLIVR